MKAEITQENKAKFFAQYWALNCICNDEFIWRSDETFDTVLSIYNGDLSGWYAKLKPLTAISNKDALELGKIGLEGDYDSSVTDEECIEYCKSDILKTDVYFYNVSDYLRSKGYALPWMGLTVQEMVEYGWIKLLT